MPGRKLGSENRYGFNGKERDKDMNSLTAYDYGFRIYNPAIGKFLSVDPLTKSYPWYTPYQFAGNKPIRFIDIDGLEEGATGIMFYDIENWINNIWNDISSVDRWIEATRNINETINPLYLGANHISKITRGKDIEGNTVDDGGNWKTRLADAGVDAFLFITGERLFKAAVVESKKIVSAINTLDVGLEKTAAFSSLEKYGGTPSNYSGLAKETVYNEAKIAVSKADDIPYIMTTVVDEATGKVYTGWNKGIKDISEVHPDLLSKMPTKSSEKWTVFNCAECDAINKALKDGVEFENIKDWHTVKIKNGVVSDVPRYQNCLETTNTLPIPTSEN